MKCRYHKKDRIFIEPETEFEQQLLAKYRNAKVYVKCGLSASDVLGLAIDAVENLDEE